MGINISMVELQPKKTDFDYIRYTGDNDFNSTDAFEKEYISLNHPRDGHYVWRPKDIDISIEWVKNNIPEGNQKRLIDALCSMKDNYSLYFSVSY